MVSKLGFLPPDVAERLGVLSKRAAQVEGLLALWLFGSFARGDSTPISDVDLAYLPNPGLEGEALERFEDRLYLLISSTLGTDEISFVNLRYAPISLRWQVLAEGILLYCRDQGAVACLAEKVYRRAPDVLWLKASGNIQFLEVFKMSGRTVDRERITEFLRLISQDLTVLQEKALVPIETYLNSRDLQSIVERRLQTAIESAINIGNHIIARLGLRPPQDYAHVFQILGEAGVLSAEMAQRMMDMARFRNLLVHVYWEIDHKRVYEALPERIKTLDSFVEDIVRWLEESSGKGKDS